MVTVVLQQTEDQVLVSPRMSQTINVLTAVSYSKPMTQHEAQQQQTNTETQAIDVGFQSNFAISKP